MKTLYPYVVYPGTCKAALEFYHTCLGGTIELMQRYEDSPLEAPKEHKDRIFNARFCVDDTVIMASDDFPPDSVVRPGTNMSLFLVLDTPTEQRDAFEKLAEGGTITMPLTDSFGMLSDKFGIQWMVVCE
ncbi:MAG: VOC family protein [Deinococcota bacterium]